MARAMGAVRNRNIPRTPGVELRSYPFSINLACKREIRRAL